MYNRIRPLIFRLDPEQAHHLTLNLLKFSAGIPGILSILKSIYQSQPKPIELFGLKFKNPVGLAAGYDKDGIAWKGLATLGFGHIEIGTVTPKPQPGNLKPRVFRLPEDKALINRMGFPSKGANYVKSKLFSKRNTDVILGVNIGKNKNTPLEEAHYDYAQLIEQFTEVADYLTINISSPNTPGLRKLQTKAYLDNLLNYLNRTRLAQPLSRPMLVKLSPDLNDAELDNALDAILANQIDGVIATNTTVSREKLSSPLKSEQGGLSGYPLTERSTETITKIVKRTNGKLPVIAAGGIMTTYDAKKKLDAGAKLVQIYTGLIYQGPSLVKQILLSYNR